MLCESTIQSINFDRELVNRKGKAKKGKKPVEQEEEKVPETPLEKLLLDLTKFFDSKLKSFEPEKTDSGDGNIIYSIPSKNARVTIAVDGIKVEVSLVNDYENQSIELQNVEFDDQKELIETEYVDKFVNGLGQIETDIKQIWAALQQGFEAANYEGSFGQTSFDKVLLNGSPQIDSLEFTMAYLNPGLVMPGEPISGYLNRDSSNFVLTIVTKFFQKSFDIGILTDGYLQSEARRMGVKTLSHLDSMYYLTENPSDDGIGRHFIFADYKSEMKNTLTTYLGGNFIVEVKDTGAVVKYGGKPVATISSHEETAGSMIFNILKCKIEVLENEEYAVVLPGSSIFGMEALADKFLIELMDDLKHALNEVDDNEQVQIFE
jgi:hypothetical protein